MLDYPKVIEIQTVSSCNAACVICPHSAVSRELPKGIMDMGLFKSIIDQIPPSLNLRIIPYLNNEPFLDPHLIRRIAYINSMRPLSEVELSTNVSRLNCQVQNKLSEVRLSELRLSVFGFTQFTHKRMMPGLDWSIVKDNLDKLVVNGQLRRQIGLISLVMIDHEYLTNKDKMLAKEYCHTHSLQFNIWGFLDRSRNVVNFSNNFYKKLLQGCELNRPFERMYITWTGKVIFCCHDWHWNYVVGNLNYESIKDVWNSEIYKKYRRVILGETSEVELELCRFCKLAI